MALLRQLGEHRFLSRPEIEELLFGDSALTPESRRVITWRILRRLTARKLVTTNARLAGKQDGMPTRIAYFLTDSGRKLLGAIEPALPMRCPPIRGTFLLAHALMVAEIALAFRRNARAQAGQKVLVWECDWQAAARLAPSPVLPDARLVYALERRQIHAFIEADRGTERTRVFSRKVAGYLDLYRSGTWRAHLPVWPLVLTVTPSERRATNLRRATEALLRARPEGARIAQAFRFAALEDLRSASGPLAEIWQVAGRAGRHPLIEAAPPSAPPPTEPRPPAPAA